jgi:NADH dehydrogenase [ubiquinone] 1 alpha subcomplex assembly factor 7
MTKLKREIAAIVEAEGPISVARYMALCLGHPVHGYYATRDPFGARGDFTTAPEISQMFGELIGLWCAEVWTRMECPSRVALVELGPGRGTLMADILRAARAVPGFFDAAALTLVETSPKLREIQARTLAGADVRWAASVEEALDPGPSPCKGEGGPARSDGSGRDRPESSSVLPDPHPALAFGQAHSPLAKGRETDALPAIVISNEFFDALPVRQFVRTREGWRERLVGPGKKAGLAFGLAAEPPDLALPNAPQGAIREISPQAVAVTTRIADHVVRHGGASLAIDYGYAGGFGDTLQALRAHAFADPLAAPGAADLTAHVDFGALGAAARRAGAATMALLPQADFLERLGLNLRAEALSRATPDKRDAIITAAARLTDRSPRGMGALFKALAFADPRLRALPAFEPDGAAR